MNPYLLQIETGRRAVESAEECGVVRGHAPDFTACSMALNCRCQVNGLLEW